MLHGPAELLPISSSGHITLIPWLLGSDLRRVDDELRKSFEVALHAGTAAALLIALRDEVREAAGSLDARRLGLLAASFLPPAIVGYTLERPIERRLGTPGTIAGGLVVGSLVMAVADRAPQTRRHEEAGLHRRAVAGHRAGVRARSRGVAQRGHAGGGPLAALHPDRRQSPVAPCGAAGDRRARRCSKGVRLARRGLPPGAVVPLAAGAAAAFASTLASRWLIGQVERNRSLAPYAVYRLGLAGAVGVRWRRERG